MRAAIYTERNALPSARLIHTECVGIDAIKSAETVSETIAEVGVVAVRRLVSEPRPYRNSRAAELFRGRYLYTPSVPRGDRLIEMMN